MNPLSELTAFIAVAESHGFSAASRHTGIPQPAISKAVAALEKRLGLTLLNRSTRKVSITEQGRRYYERIKPLIDALAEADAEATGSTESVSGFLRVSAPATFGRLHVLPLLPALLAGNPGLRLDLILSDQFRDMAEDGIDLAIRVGPNTEQDAIIRRVAGSDVVCVGSRPYFQRHGLPETPADLVHHNCLLSGNQRDPADWPLLGPDGRYGIRVSGSLSSNSIETIRAGVLAGIGIGMMTRASLTGELAHPDIVTILERFAPPARDIHLVWPKRRFVPARLRHTTDYFAAALAQRLRETPDHA